MSGFIELLTGFYLSFLIVFSTSMGYAWGRIALINLSDIKSVSNIVSNKHNTTPVIYISVAITFLCLGVLTANIFDLAKFMTDQPTVFVSRFNTVGYFVFKTMLVIALTFKCLAYDAIHEKNLLTANILVTVVAWLVLLALK